MKNLYRQIRKKVRRKVIFIVYRIMREDMVIRMRVNGFTWTRMNAVLRVLGQKQIIKVEKRQHGEILTYANVKQGEKLAQVKGRWKKVQVEHTPEIIHNN